MNTARNWRAFDSYIFLIDNTCMGFFKEQIQYLCVFIYLYTFANIPLKTSPLFQVLKTLGQKKRRNVPLLRKLTYHLQKRLMGLDLRSFCDILFTLNQLSFKADVRMIFSSTIKIFQLLSSSMPSWIVIVLLFRGLSCPKHATKLKSWLTWKPLLPPSALC